MKNSFFILSRTTTLIVLLFMNTPLYAVPETIDKRQAVDIAQQVYPGRVLSVKQKDNLFYVKTLNDNGEVRVIIIDADDGKVVSGT